MAAPSNRLLIRLLILLCFSLTLSAQAQEKRHFLEPADTLDKTRFWVSAITGATIYTGFSIGLWEAWYKDYPLSSFHLFNDLGEWQDIDKMGHLFAANIECNASFNGALWTGMDRRSAMWTAAGIGTLLQTTFEVMDGFSANWGFSIADIAFNTAGVGLFVGQELAWQEQRIIMKVSSSPPRYDNNMPIFSVDGGHQTTIQQRIDDLYGTTFFEKFIKDYNGQTTWASINIHAFLTPEKQRNTRLPKWFNVAIGYGGDNMFGGFANTWETEEGIQYILDDPQYNRYRQFYLSFDVDLDRIPTKSRVLKTLFNLVNWIKIPAPAIELNTQGKVIFHPIYW
jgi:hypothetical protein